LKVHEAAQAFFSSLLKELSYHPFVSPYLNISYEFPLQHYLHQYEAIALLALRRPIRILIGDEIGLGKTITAIMIAKYLEKLRRVNRVLIIVPRVLVTQWRKELQKMGIPESKIKRIESYTLDFLKLQNFSEGYYIASMDLLKRTEKIKEVLNVPWDLIIVDEAHRFGYKTKRFWHLGKLLIEKFPERNVIFLSATPHRGNPQDYILRLRLIDPYLVEGWKSLDKRQFYEVTHGAILLRRTKEDVNKIYEERTVFPPAKFYASVIAAREDEKTFVKELVTFLRSKLIEFAFQRNLLSEKVIPLLTILIFKRATSSPYAAWKTLQRLLLKRVEPDFSEELIDSVKSFFNIGYEDFEYYDDKDPEEVFNEFLDRASPLLSERDVIEIQKLREAATSIMKTGDSKLNALISLLEDILDKGRNKVIVFTEYKDTLEYIVEQLTKRHPEWSSMILTLSAEETREEKKFRRIREKFQRDPTARILIATDVVAEGVNLQVANILVNYEIPWSLMKVEQRVGRVWRLGQKNEVEVYTLFMDNVADMAALNSMYRKLINLRRAALQPRPITGQEILFYAEDEDLARIPPSIAIIKKTGRKKFLRVTEARSILTYLREGERGLERLIASILAAKQEIERDLASKSVLYKPKRKQEVERTVGLLGFRNPAELLTSIKHLVEAFSRILGFRVWKTNDHLKVAKGSEMPVTLDSIDKIYGIFSTDKSEHQIISIVSYGESEQKLAIVPIRAKDRKTGTILYSEPIGVNLNSGKILRGASLLEAVSQATIGFLGVTETRQNIVIPLTIQVEIIDTIKRNILGTLNTLDQYRSRLIDLNLRDADRNWIKRPDIEVVLLDPIACLQFVKMPGHLTKDISEGLKRYIEEEAEKFVIEVEKMEGRIPKKVSESEHYDIKSIDPSTGEVRLIEVKGHSGPEIYAELTDQEANLAKAAGERYWLYIVYDIRSGNPKLLRFRDPLNTMNWKIFEKIERRYKLWPRI